MDKKYSVYWWDNQGNQIRELFVEDIEKVKEAVTRLTRGPAATIGIVRRVIITDSLDYINFEWRFQEGVVYPPLK
jgi:hypothetical protein